MELWRLAIYLQDPGLESPVVILQSGLSHYMCMNLGIVYDTHHQL